jgi:hypothetical protein
LEFLWNEAPFEIIQVDRFKVRDVPTPKIMKTEVSNYVDAMMHGLDVLRDPKGLPLCLRLLRDMHARPLIPDPRSLLYNCGLFFFRHERCFWSNAMKFNILPAGSGGNWVTQGFALVRRNPFPIILAMLASGVCIIVLSLMPILNVFTGILGASIFAGLLSICRKLDQSGRVSADDFFHFLKTRFPQLLGLGALYFAACIAAFIVAIGVFFLVAGDLQEFSPIFQEILSRSASGTPLEPKDLEAMLSAVSVETVIRLAKGLMWMFLVWLVLMFPVFMAYWFAPLLVAWNDLSPFKAAAFSFIAVLKNWRAFLVYSIVILVLSCALGFVLGIFQIVFSLLLPIFFAMLMHFLLFFIFSLAIAAMTLASIYYSYKDVFHVTLPPAPEQEQEESW